MQEIRRIQVLTRRSSIKYTEASILSNHRAFYPKGLSNELVFELSLAPASDVVKGSDPTKITYELTNIELE